MTWYDQLDTLTPVERHGDLLFKRDDLFAPLGAGGINGAKLRQCIWLVDGAVAQGCPGLVSGASVKSPQLMMTTVVAKHFGIKAHHVIGVSKFPGALKHVSVDIASHFGATFDVIGVAYNPALQRKVKDLLENEYKGWFHLEYGISLNHKTNPASLIRDFHSIGALQVTNLPPVSRLIIPAGSCNSATSILYGLWLYKRPVKEIVLLGIGPNKTAWMLERLKCIDPSFNLTWSYHDLMGLWSYQDEQHFEYSGIQFHPTYEGKCMKYLTAHKPELLSEDTCFWIIGGQVNRDYMKGVYEHVSPEKVSV